MGALELHRRFDAPSDRINLASRDKPVSVSDTVIASEASNYSLTHVTG